MGLYSPFESADGHRLQHIAKVEFRLKKERDFGASVYKKYRRGFNILDGLDTALSTPSVGLAASGIGLLSTIIAMPVAIDIQAGAVVCGLLGASGKVAGRAKSWHLSLNVSCWRVSEHSLVKIVLIVLE